MTDSIAAYEFDFAAEIDRLRQDAGAAADNILFVKFDATPAGIGGIAVPTSIGPEHLTDPERLTFVRSHISAKLRENPNHSSYVQTVYNGEPLAYSYSYLAFRKNHQTYGLFGTENEDLCRLGTIYHEAAHALLHHNDAGVDEDHPFKECAADAFAALSLLRRFGKDAIPAISLRSWSRAFHALNEGLTEHLTTPVLEKIIADAGTRDFSKLTLDETLALAVDYAEKWTPTPEMLTALRSFVPPDEPPLSRAFDAATSCLAAPDDFSFYIGAKFYEPFLEPEGVAFGNHLLQLEDDHRTGCAATIEERAAGLRLGDIFNGTAQPQKKGPALADAIPTRLPAQQKQFVLSFSQS